MKKKLFVFLVFIFFIFIFRGEITNYAVQKILSFAVHQWDGSLKYTHFEKTKGKWLVKNIEIEKKNHSKIQIESLEIVSSFDWNNFKLLIHLEAESPKIHLLSEKLILPKKNSKIQTSCNIKNGYLTLNSQSYYFDCVQDRFSRKKKIYVRCQNSDTLNLEIIYNHVDPIRLAECKFYDFDLASLEELRCLFSAKHSFESVKGKLSGLCAFQFDHELKHFFYKVSFKDLNLKYAKHIPCVQIERGKIEGEYPKSSLLKSNWCLSDFIHKMGFCLTFENGKIQSNLSNHLQELAGTISYNPGIGPKWDIKGYAVVDDKSFPIQTNGKGFFHSIFSNWIKASLEFPDLNSTIALNLDEQKDKTIIYECKISELHPLNMQHLQHLVGIFYKKPLSITLEKGVANAEFFGRWTPHNSVQFNIENLSGSVVIKNGKISYLKPEYTLDHLQVNIQISSGRIHPSKIEFQSNQTKGFATIQGKIQDPLIQSQINGSFKDVLNFHPSFQHLSGYSPLNFQTKFTLKKEGFFGTFAFIDDKQDPLDSFTFGFTLKNLLDKEASFASKIHHGWIKAEQVQLQRCHLSLKGTANLSATIEEQMLHVLIAGKQIEGSFCGTTFKINEIKNETLENNQYAHIDYSFKDNRLSFELPLVSEFCTVSKYDLQFENIQGRLVFDDDLLKINIEKTQCEGIDFSGIIYFQKKSQNLQIFSNYIKGSIESLTKFLSKLSINTSYLEHLSGNFLSHNDGFYLTTVINDPLVPIQFKGSGKICDGNYPISQNGSLQKLEGNFFISSFEQTFRLDQIKAKLFIQSAKTQQVCDVYIPFLQKKENFYQYDIRVSKSFWDILRIAGSAQTDSHFWTFQLNKKRTHFFGTKLNVDRLVVQKPFGIVSLKMAPQINLSSLMSEHAIISEFFPINISSLNTYFDQDLLGRICCHINYERDSDSTIKISGNNLKFNQNEIGQLVIEAKKQKDFWDISRIIAGPVNAKCTLSYHNAQIFIKNFSADFPEIGFLKMNCTIQDNFQLNGDINALQIEGSSLKKIFYKDFDLSGKIQGVGRFSIDLPYKNKKWQIESDLDLKTSKLTSNEFSIENTGAVQIYFSLQEGLVVKGLDLHIFHPKEEFTWMKCKIGRLYHKAKDEKYSYSDLQLYLPKKGIDRLSEEKKWAKPIQKIKDWLDFENDLEFCAKGSFDAKSLELSLEMSEYLFHIKDQEYFLRDIHLLLQPNKIQGEFRAKYQKKFIPMGFSINFKESINGDIFFKEKHFSPLTIQWLYNHGFYVQSIHGSFHGLDASFHKETNDKNSPFIGTLKVDLKKAKDLAPLLMNQFFTELNMQKGYELRGRLYLDPFCFEGMFSGKDCVLAGCVFRTLLSSIQMKKNSVQITDFKISDRSGIFKMDQIHIEKNNENRWLFSIPNIHIKEFRPSLLQKVDQKLGEIKPLVIRKLSIQDFHGDLEEKSTFEGKGSLNFVNSFKREHTLLDIPADFFGRIFGLDMELLIPVTGSLNFDIHDRKFFIQDLKEAYSEGKRSKFFLVDRKDPHILDFDGNLNVYIQMKHFVLFKFTEPFILSIEGKLEDPKFSLKTKKSFFSSK